MEAISAKISNFVKELLKETTFIIKEGKNFNQTYASVRFDRWGKLITDHDVRVVSCWNDVLNEKKLRKWLFCVKSGTIFNDIWDFFQNIDPSLLKTGMGHLTLDTESNELYLNDMAFFIRSKDLDLTPLKKFPNFTLSSKNIHHDYTPLSVKQAKGYKQLAQERFGQSIIARHLEHYGYFNNFPSKLREFKIYDYENNKKDIFKEFTDLAENTLWIFNNEKLHIHEGETVLMPGAGVWPMLQRSKKILVNDISVLQCKFLTHCLEKWDGKNYGELVYDFIIENKVFHYHYNIGEKQVRDRQTIKNKKQFVDEINDNFNLLWQKYGKGEWLQHWNQQKSRITVENKNLLNSCKKFTRQDIELSNVLDYKYNYIKDYVDKWRNLISLPTQAFIRKNYNNVKNPYRDPPCKEVFLDVPVDAIHEEIHNIKHLLVNHRDNDGVGWKSFCIHGQSYDRTREADAYKDFLGYRWTDEAKKFMPNTIKWLKSLPYKNYARVRVMCLEPKGFINIHRDRKDSKLGPINVAITQPKGCDFYLENHGVIDFVPGRAFKLNLVNFHAVINNSNQYRYHIIIHHDS